MCGISGIIYNNIPKQTEKFKTCSNLQAHRGPDFTGYFGDDYSDFVHHRLSILDLDRRSHQPFTDQKKENYLVYNGEIYNFKDLIKKYQLKVKTTSDTEVLHQLLSRSDFSYNEINGIYAFGLYNLKEKSLELVRDKLGVKPLYYYHSRDFFIFSSEAKVIYAYLDELKIDYQVLSEYLKFGHSNGLNTIVTGVKKIQPGTTLKLNLETFKIKTNQFWSLENKVKYQIKPNYKEAQKQTKKLLEKAIQRQCLSDVPVGAYLSGGIDSSAVVAIASRYTNSRLLTYSVDFDQNSYSELKAAEQVARQYRTEHYQFQVKIEGVEEFLSGLIYQYDEPFADPAMIPLHLIAQRAGISSKVILQGDGGDEIFAGYGRHLDAMQFVKRKTLFRALKTLHYKKSLRDYYRFRYDTLNCKHKAELFANLVPSDEISEYKDYIKENKRHHLENANPYKHYHQSHNKFKNYPSMQALLYTDMENILPYKYLEKVDKVNMWHSLEARVPFLDDDLVDYVMRLPHTYKIKKGTTKFFLRDLLSDYLPHKILNGRKRSFGTPVNNWLSTSLFNYTEEVFKKGEKAEYPIDYKLLLFNLHNFKRTKDTHLGSLIWKILILTLWFDQYDKKLKF